MLNDTVSSAGECFQFPKSVMPYISAAYPQGAGCLVAREVEALINANKLRRGDLEYISNLRLSLLDRELSVSDDTLERLRALCALWEVDLKPGAITSHRKLIGPIIVAAKKLAFPILRAFLKDSFRRQRDFNAAVVVLLSDLARKIDNPGQNAAGPSCSGKK